MTTGEPAAETKRRHCAVTITDLSFNAIAYGKLPSPMGRLRAFAVRTMHRCPALALAASRAADFAKYRKAGVKFCLRHAFAQRNYL
jgi:hypothetical protein